MVMVFIGVGCWLVSAVAVVVVTTLRANGRPLSFKLSDSAIFTAIIAGFYSPVYGLAGAMYGAGVGAISGFMAGGAANIRSDVAYGAIIGGSLGPLFIAYVLARAGVTNLPFTPPP